MTRHTPAVTRFKLLDMLTKYFALKLVIFVYIHFERKYITPSVNIH